MSRLCRQSTADPCSVSLFSACTECTTPDCAATYAFVQLARLFFVDAYKAKHGVALDPASLVATDEVRALAYAGI